MWSRTLTSCSRRRCPSCSSTSSRGSRSRAATIPPESWDTWSAPPFSPRGSSSRATSTPSRKAGSGGCAAPRASLSGAASLDRMTSRPVADRLGDFTADARVLTLTLLAAVIGVVSALVALALVRLIGLFTHLFYYHEIAGTLVSPAANRLGAWALAVPVGGGDGGGIRHSGGGGPAGRRADAVRVEAAQPHPGGGRVRRGRRPAGAAARRGSAVPRRAPPPPPRGRARGGARPRHRRRVRVRAPHLARLRLRGSVPQAAHPLDVVAHSRRGRGRARRPALPARARRRLRHHRRLAHGAARRRDAGRPPAHERGDLGPGARLGHIGWRARAAPHHGRRPRRARRERRGRRRHRALARDRHGRDHGRP